MVVKDRSDALVAGFFASLAEEHPAFASAARAYAWTGGDDPAKTALLENADAVVAFGRDETLRAIRARCGVDTRFVGFGHRASIGRLTRDDVAALDDALADRIVRDALLYDGEGCLSLHALFVQADGAALARVAAALAAACERVAVEFPGGARSPARQRGGRGVPQPRRVSRGERARRGVPRRRRRAGRRSAARRSAAVPAARDPARPRRRRRRDRRVRRRAAAAGASLGVVGADAAAVALAERIGAVRVAPFGTMQAPPLGGHHGGAPRIADFVRWIDLG